MATNKYKLSFDNFKMVFQVTYTNGKFKRMDYLNGKYDLNRWEILNKAVPFLENDLASLRTTFKGSVHYDLIEKPSPTLYTELLGVYMTWHKKEKGMKPKMNGTEGDALNSMIKYFIDNSLTHEETVNTWNAMFTNWDSLDEFYQKQTKLTQISCYLTNILIQLKDGTGKTKQHSATTAKTNAQSIIERRRNQQ